MFAHPLLSAILARLNDSTNAFSTRIEEDIAKLQAGAAKEIEGPWRTASRDEAVALAIAALKYASTIDLLNWRNRQGYVVALVAAAYSADQHKNPTVEGIIESLRDVSVQSLYDYLDEAIDSRNSVLGLLVKYKARCEMYRRQRLRDAATKGLEGRSGERALAFDLYEYLHDQGVDFWIESVSASGEPDLVSRDAQGERLVADAKYVDQGSNVRRTVWSGFRQVLDYCRDHNEPVGYLVVFINRDVVLDIQGDRDGGFPCVRTGGYTVYYVMIDIHDHEVSASKRAKPTVVEITRQDLLSAVGGEVPPSASEST